VELLHRHAAVVVAAALAALLHNTAHHAVADRNTDDAVVLGTVDGGDDGAVALVLESRLQQGALPTLETSTALHHQEIPHVP
jgi:hypothetical protein